jgi:hypothetical protein
MPPKQGFFSKLAECFGSAIILMVQLVIALVLIINLSDRHH